MMKLSTKRRIKKSFVKAYLTVMLVIPQAIIYVLVSKAYFPWIFNTNLALLIVVVPLGLLTYWVIEFLMPEK